MDGGLKTPGTTGYQRLRSMPLGTNEIDRKLTVCLQDDLQLFHSCGIYICWLYHALPLLPYT